MITQKPATSCTALLLIDFQIDFLRPNGRFPVAQHQVEPMLEAANRLIEATQDLLLETVYIGNEFSKWDIPANWIRHNATLQGQPGVELDERLKQVNAHYFFKQKDSAFSNPALDLFLQSRQIKKLVLTGVYATACVRRTAEAALAKGYDVVVVWDAVAASNDRSKEAALCLLQKEGVHITTSDQILAQPVAA